MKLVGRHLLLGDSEIFVRDVGSGEPVVLCNGIGAHVEMWGPLERVLSGLRVVSFDAPGTGRSQTPYTPTRMPRLAELVVALLNELGLERAHIVGYSFGGAIAQQLAVQFPDRVDRLVLAGTTPGWGGVPGRLGAMLSLGTPLRYYSRTFYEHTAGTIAGGRARYDAEHVRDLWRSRAMHAPSPIGYGQQLWAMTTWSGFRALSRIAAPTLVVVGDDDPLVPLSNGLMIAARIPNARLVVGAGEGHFQLLDEDSIALPAIRDFLTADDLEAAPVWQSALSVDHAAAEEQRRADGLGALPWGAVSAVYRQVFG